MMLRPLRDQIIVKPLDWRPSAILAIAGNQRRTLRGVVVAIGPGRRVLKYWKNSRGERCKMGETGQVIPTEVKPGDVVELGGLEIDGYKFKTVDIDNVQHVLCQEADVCFVCEDNLSGTENGQP